MRRPRPLLATPRARAARLAIPAAAVLLAVAPSAAGAATFTVNSVVDGVDSSAGDGICATSGNACTLRAAIDEATVSPGADTITVPAGTFQLVSGLGALTVNTTVTINGAGARATIIRAAANSRVVNVGATATLRDLAVTGGNVSSTGYVTGGGIRITGGDVTLERLLVKGNSTSSSQSAGGGGIGGDSMLATVTVIDSTITENTTNGFYNGGNQGGASGGGLNTIGPTFIRRSTIAGNVVVGGITSAAAGGGVAVNGPTTIDQSTIAGNGVATIGGGSGSRKGGNLYVNAALKIGGTILSGGTGSVGPDCWREIGTVAETARNLAATSGNCLGAGALIADPKLGVLADNGGPTDTMRLGAGSPAIDAAASCGERTTDQRGNSLFGGTGCDLGAVEYAASRSVTLQASKTSAAAGEEITFVAKLASAGLDEATDETLTLALPAGVTPTTATATAGTCTVAQTITCALGNVARGASVSVIVTARAPGGDFTATATRSGAVPDQSAADDQASVPIAGVASPGGAGAPAGGTGAPQADALAPTITGLALIRKPRASVRKGAALQLTLSESATVQVTVERITRGRLAGKACAAKGKGKRCERATKIVTLTTQLGAGPQRIALTRKQLRAGTLRFTILATDAAGNRSTASVQGAVRR